MRRAMAHFFRPELLFIFLWIQQTHATQGDFCRVLRYAEPIHNSSLSNHVVSDFEVENQDQCEIQCFLNQTCTSYNFGTSQDGRQICELNDADANLYPQDMFPRAGFTYRDAEEGCGRTMCPSQAFCQYHIVNKTYNCICKTGLVAPNCKQGMGMSKSTAAVACWQLTLLLPTLPSGLYWIDPDGGSKNNSFQAYCDMETDGGGWTLVYSYTFSNYEDFMNKTNIVTPRPDWVTTGEAPISTTVPMNETHFAAMSFALWKFIGREFLIKSNINNWIACIPSAGSLVDYVEGAVTCRMIKSITILCRDVVPAFLKWGVSCGPKLRLSPTGGASTNYFHFDSCIIRDNAPVHDPCGSRSDNHLKNVSNPHGNIYIR